MIEEVHGQATLRCAVPDRWRKPYHKSSGRLITQRRLDRRLKVKNVSNRLVSHEEGFVHIVLIFLVAAFLIAVGVLIGYAVWGK